MSDPISRFRLDGQVAIVTGASSGIGEQTARTFVGAGATVIGIARRAERLALLATELDGFVAMPCDVLDDAAVASVVAAVIKQFGKVDILVNNAGISDPTPAIDESLDDFRRVIDIDLTACFLFAQLCARSMRDNGGGSIINVASVHGFVGAAPNNQPGYTAAKGGLINLTRELALEWARYGIRVNALAPGYIETELTDEMIAGENGRAWIERNTPMRRPGRVDELDGAMLLLASDAGSYMTGETIAIDGGWLAR